MPHLTLQEFIIWSSQHSRYFKWSISIFGFDLCSVCSFGQSICFGKKINSSSSIHFKAEAGAGIPYGNTNTSLPYDYSFAGGSNDNRGEVRSLGPGAYKYHLDTNRTLTNRDVRIELN